jgi:hypothetical protein
VELHGAPPLKARLIVSVLRQQEQLHLERLLLVAKHLAQCAGVRLES